VFAKVPFELHGFRSVARFEDQVEPLRLEAIPAGEVSKTDGILVLSEGFMPIKRLCYDVCHIHQVTPPGVTSAGLPYPATSRLFPRFSAHFGHYQKFARV